MKEGEDDEFIGYEIPVQFSDDKKENMSPTFNLEALEADRGQARFEMMEIHITLYALSGILYQTKKSGDKRRKRSDRSGTWRKGRSSKSSIGSDAYTAAGTSTQEGGTTLSTITESCSTPALMGFEMNPLLAPTTAVVSSTRHDPLSDRPMETFMPSLPLHRLSRGDAQALRYSARWTTESKSQGTEGEEQSCPSFKILRLMNQQQYIPSTRIGEISTYEHQQVDLCVFVGRGKEMLPVGVVSFVVTGDEETETILNLPVNKPAAGSSHFDRHFKQSKRKKGPQDSFQSDPRHMFTVGSHATLRVGVRTFPQRSFIEADERSAVAREKEEKVFESVLEKILDAELLDNLQEENSLVRKIVDAQKQQIQEEQQQRVQEFLMLNQEALLQPKQQPQVQAPPAVPQTPAALVQPNLFCSFSFFQNQACLGQKADAPAIPQQVVTVKRNKVNDEDGNATIPLTLVSSVSESVTTVGGHSNTRFRNERANI